MNNNCARVIPSCLAILFLAACSGSSISSNGSSDAGADLDAGPTIEQACTDVAQARCAKFGECEATGIASRYGDEATCLVREKLSCEDGLAAPGTANSPARVETCVAAFGSYTCADFLNANPPDACRAPAGAKALGEVCAFNAQCQSAFCTVPKGTNCGTCAAMPNVGDSCATVTSCGYDLVCSKITELCSRWAVVGDPCGKGDNICGFGLGCAGATDTSLGTCQPLATLGQACGTKAEAVCDTAAGLYCTGGTCAPALLSGPGGSCGPLAADAGSDAGALRGYCMGASSCDPDAGVCAGPAPDHGACNTADGHIACMAPARCVGASSEAGVVGTCELPTGICAAP